MSIQKHKNSHLPPMARLGRYTIIKKISSGGFGVVYLATRDDEQAVAIKEYLPQHILCRSPRDRLNINIQKTEDERRFQEGLHAFFKEADTLARVHHEKVISVWDVFEANGTAYFVMPVEKGCTLHALLRQRGRFSDLMLQRFFIEATQGVVALHEHGLLHLDLKPGNLWVRPDGTLIVLDLGASRWADEESRSSQLAKTPGFAAPEQYSLKSTHQLSVSTDLYGLMASLYACIECHPPKPAPERTKQDVPLADLRRGQRHPQLLELVDFGIQLDPHHRPQHAKQILEVLERIPLKYNREHEHTDPWSPRRYFKMGWVDQHQ